MELLDAALAWALTMGALGTVCTIVLEVFNRAFKVRGKGLRTLVRDHMIEPLLENAACEPLLVGSPKDGKSKEQTKAAYTQKVVDAITLCWVGSLGKQRSWFWNRSETARTFERVSLRHFLLMLTRESKPLLGLLLHGPMEKPGATDTGKLGAAHVNYQRARGVLMTAAQVYDDASSASSESFRRSAAMWTVFIGMVLALVANIDAVRVFDEYMENPELAQTIIDESEALEAGSVAAQASLEKTRQLGLELAKLHADIVEMETGQASTDGIAEKRAEFAKVKAELESREGADAIANTAATAVAGIKSLKEKGVPIGWGYYPGIFEEPETVAKVRETENATPGVSGALTTVIENISKNVSTDGSEFGAWLFKVLVTGLLIGLGGPFWFDLARRLAMVRRVVSGTTKPAPVDSREAAATTDAVTTAAIVEEVLDHFIAERVPPAPAQSAS